MPINLRRPRASVASPTADDELVVEVAHADGAFGAGQFRQHAVRVWFLHTGRPAAARRSGGRGRVQPLTDREHGQRAGHGHQSHHAALCRNTSTSHQRSTTDTSVQYQYYAPNIRTTVSSECVSVQSQWILVASQRMRYSGSEVKARYFFLTSLPTSHLLYRFLFYI